MSCGDETDITTLQSVIFVPGYSQHGSITTVQIRVQGPSQTAGRRPAGRGKVETAS